MISCQVAHDGRLADCRVLSEIPMGEDFGVAAIALSQKFRMLPPPDGDAKPAEVTIPILFKMPASSWPGLKPATTAQPRRAEPSFTPLDSGDILMIAGLGAVAFALLTLLFAVSGRTGRKGRDL